MKEYKITDLDSDVLRVYPPIRRYGCSGDLVRLQVDMEERSACVDLSPFQVKELRKVLKNWLKETEK